jgi:CBS domain containing-hemolysin-like protein
MTPLTLFLLACVTIFLGTVQASFSALMRLSLRLMAERGGRSDRLGHYLDDPLELFIPVRALIGVCTVLAGVLIARLSDVHGAQALAIFFVSLVAFVVLCELVVPALIVRLAGSDPERVLDVLLPAFHPVARLLRPLTFAVVDLKATRDR